MTKFGRTIFGLVILLILGIGVFFLQKEPVTAPEIVDEKVSEVVIPIGNEILGNKDDLVSFSITPGQKVSGLLNFSGSVRGAYFFEANIVINILDSDKNLLKASNTMATTDWMTSEPVSFAGSIDLAGLPKGPAYFEIHNDNASGLSEYDKSIQIPIVIE